MDWREQLEKREAEELSPFAALSRNSKGRVEWEERCQVRTEFQRDRDRILHSKAFRRLKHKTQVFIAPEGDHFRTRLTHTLEVAQIARTICRALRLNEDLAEAIALGHDLGHTPFGHAGEEALDDVYPGGFRHNHQSLRVVEKLEGGKGLNLTEEVRDGILHHTGPGTPFTLEGQVVKIADRVAYINHDIDDAVRAGIITEEDLPAESLKVLGYNHRQRINTMVLDLIQTNQGASAITMTPAVQKATNDLREFLFARVYIGSRAKTEESKAKRMLKELYRHFAEGNGAPAGMEEREVWRWACDYIAGMTDNYAIRLYRELFVPKGFSG